MRKTFLVIFIVTIVGSFAQAQISKYFPLLDTASKWCGSIVAILGGCGDAIDDYQMHLRDTIINGVNYKSALSSGHESGCDGNYNYLNNYFALYREDTLNRKVYLTYLGRSEELLYDFTLTLGDTFSGSKSLVVSSVDSALVNDTFHKRITFRTEGSWTEGIGSTFGPFFNQRESFFDTLNAFSQDGKIVYPDSNFSCDIPTSIQSQPNENATFVFFPDPASSILNIKINQTRFNAEPVELRIINSSGDIVLTRKLPQQIIFKSYRINVSNLPVGLYFLILTNLSGDLINKNSKAFSVAR